MDRRRRHGQRRVIEERVVVDYIGVSDVQRLVQAIGAGAFMERLAAEIEADYRRWGEFESRRAWRAILRWA